MGDIPQLVTRVLENTPCSQQATALIVVWIERVAAWTEKVDLTAARDDRELVDLLVADAAVLAGAIGPRRRVVDVGCGAGAPGFPLALLRSDLDITLVEPMQKRVALLRLCAGTTPADRRPQVVMSRAEALLRSQPFEPFDVAVSRATLPPTDWLRLGAELAPRGQVWVLLAQGAPPALAGWQPSESLQYRWPLTGAERRAVSFRRMQGG